jgi:hypothetical protein
MGFTKGNQMKSTLTPQSAPVLVPTKVPAIGRFQIHLEFRSGNFTPGFHADSDAEIIEAFILQAPVYDGGEIRVLDRAEQRMVAFVKWRIVRTELGLPVLHRANVFLDWHLALIACDFQRQQQSRDRVEMELLG